MHSIVPVMIRSLPGARTIVQSRLLSTSSTLRASMQFTDDHHIEPKKEENLSNKILNLFKRDSPEEPLLPPVPGVQYGVDAERERKEFMGIDLMKYWENDYLNRNVDKVQQINELNARYGNELSEDEIGEESEDVRALQRQRLAEMHQDNPRLTHVDSESQKARMVDVSRKPITRRSAEAECRVLVGKEVFGLLQENRIRKGNALGVAQVAGIMAAKRTSELIPLCHPIALEDVQVEMELCKEDASVSIRARVICEGKTGCEMEALTAVSVSALALYDMCKSASKEIVIGQIRLLSKQGGKSDFMGGNQVADLFMME